MSETAAAPVVQAPIPPKPNGTAPKPVEVDPKAPKAEAKADPLAEREALIKQKDAAAAKKFDEAAKMRKEAEAIQTLLKTDPDAALRKMGIDPDEYHAKRSANAERLKGLTPEQREIERLRQESADKDARLKDVEAREKEAKDAELVKQTEGWLERELLASAVKLGADQTPDMLEMMAIVGLELGEQGITPQTAGWADHVVREAQVRVDANLQQFHQKQIAKAIAAGNVEKLKSLIGADGVNLILKDSVTKIPSAGHQRQAVATETPREGKGHVSPAEFDRKFGFSARRK